MPCEIESAQEEADGSNGKNHCAKTRPPKECSRQDPVFGEILRRGNPRQEVPSAEMPWRVGQTAKKRVGKQLLEQRSLGINVVA